MEWASDIQRDWLESEAERVRLKAWQAALLDEWPAQHVMRCRLDSGEAAWLRLTKAGDLMCVAIAPWDDTWPVDHVPVLDFFATKWPATWRTKTRDNEAVLPENAVMVFEVGAPCVGIEKTGRRVVLCEVADASTDGVTLLAVRPDPYGMPDWTMSIDEMSERYKRWWPMRPDYVDRARMLMQKTGRMVTAHNWHFLCIMCSNAEMSPHARAKAKKGIVAPEAAPAKPRGRKAAGKAAAPRERRGDTIDDIMAWPEWPAMTDRAEAVVMRHPDDTVAQAHAKIRAALKAEWPWLTDRHLDMILE